MACLHVSCLLYVSEGAGGSRSHVAGEVLYALLYVGKPASGAPTAALAAGPASYLLHACMLTHKALHYGCPLRCGCLAGVAHQGSCRAEAGRVKGQEAPTEAAGSSSSSTQQPVAICSAVSGAISSSRSSTSGWQGGYAWAHTPETGRPGQQWATAGGAGKYCTGCSGWWCWGCWCSTCCLTEAFTATGEVQLSIRWGWHSLLI